MGTAGAAGVAAGGGIGSTLTTHGFQETQASAASETPTVIPITAGITGAVPAAGGGTTIEIHPPVVIIPSQAAPPPPAPPPPPPPPGPPPTPVLVIPQQPPPSPPPQPLTIPTPQPEPQHQPPPEILAAPFPQSAFHPPGLPPAGQYGTTQVVQPRIESLLESQPAGGGLTLNLEPQSGEIPSGGLPFTIQPSGFPSGGQPITIQPSGFPSGGQPLQIQHGLTIGQQQPLEITPSPGPGSGGCNCGPQGPYQTLPLNLPKKPLSYTPPQLGASCGIYGGLSIPGDQIGGFLNG